MKNLTIGLVAAVGVLAAMPALARNSGVAVNATTPAQCGVSGPTTATITGGAAGLADTNGMLEATVQTRILAALNQTATSAWCTGLSTVNLTRTPLVRVGTNGRIDSSGFANAIGYDVAININNARRFTGFATANGGLEFSSDGPIGAILRAFGPRGDGSLVTFLNDQLPIASFNATPRTLSLTSPTSYTGISAILRLQAVNTPRRLAAGDYTSTVTLTLSPIN